ncbi:MAG: SDR family NAD(P)-dependent oxidoreductase [Candidatus Flexifilum sp.]|jgi:NAD(P)-dependent dehydrogenase (short-subunit alcohol dehydrogenase family)
MTLDFADRVVLVTGSSRGIGAASALAFARRGAHVVVNYREDRAGAEAVAAQIAAEGGRAAIIQADVAVEADVRRLAEQIAATVGPLRVVVHNASPGNRAAFLEVTLAEFDAMFNGIVRGPYLLSQLAARQMIAAGRGGAIVHVSTILARLAIPRRTLYIAAKSAIEGLTRAMALDLVEHDIRVNTIAPGLIYTEALRANMAALGEDRFTPYIPGRRFGTAEEVAEAIVFVASDAASYINGALIPVDHGLSAREAGPPAE